VFPFLLQVRHNVRPYFLGSPTLKFVYDVITWAATQIAICYTVVPFVLLSVGPSLKFYRLAGQTRTETKNAALFFVFIHDILLFPSLCRSRYFCIHIGCILLAIALPVKPRHLRLKEQQSAVQPSLESTDSNSNQKPKAT